MSEENLEKEQRGKNPLELDIRFLKYYYTCYEHQCCYEWQRCWACLAAQNL